MTEYETVEEWVATPHPEDIERMKEEREMTTYETIKIAQYELSGVFSLDELKELVQQIEEHEAKMREHLAKAMEKTNE